jgi:hypothetical protein
MSGWDTFKKEKISMAGLVILIAMLVAIIAIILCMVRPGPGLDPTQEARPVFSYKQGNGTIVYEGQVYIRQTYKDR